MFHLLIQNFILYQHFKIELICSTFYYNSKNVLNVLIKIDLFCEIFKCSVKTNFQVKL